MDYKKLLNLFNRAVNKKSNINALYYNAAKYVMPHRNDLYTSGGMDTPQEKLDQDIVFDSTPIISNAKFISMVQSYLVPAGSRWSSIIVNAAANKIIPQKLADAARLDAEKLTDRAFSTLANSNFDTEFGESLYDYSLGTGVLVCNPSDEPGKLLTFTCVPVSHIYLDKSPSGGVGNVFRKLKLPAVHISVLWPDSNIPTSLAKHGDNEVEVIEAVVVDYLTSEKLVINSQGVAEKRSVSQKLYRYYIFSPECEDILLEREYGVNPFIPYRFATMPGEVFGIGVSVMALPDIQSLNTLKRLLLRRGLLDAEPPLVTSRESAISFQSEQVAPGSIIPIDFFGGMDGGYPRELFAPRPFNLAQFVFADMQQSINDSMFANPIGNMQEAVRTATEVGYRQKTLADRIGSSFGRLQEELLDPVLNIVVYYLAKAGELDDLVSLKAAQDMTDIDLLGFRYESPIATAQKQEKIANIQTFIQSIYALLGPQQGLKAVNMGEIIRELANGYNVSQSIMLSSEELASVIDETKQRISSMQDAATQQPSA